VLAQSALSLQFPPPSPLHVSVDGLTVSETAAVAVFPAVSYAVTLKFVVPNVLEAGMVIVPVHVPLVELPLVRVNGTEDEPPMGIKFIVALLIVPEFAVTVTLMTTF
jgi:hypothetical protein